MVTTIPSPSRPSCHSQEALAEPPERRRLPFEAVDLSVHGRREAGAGGVGTTELPELVFQMLLGLRGYVPDPLFLLQSGDEISGHRHIVTVGDSASNVIRASGDRQDGAESHRSLSIPWRSSC